MENLYPIQSPAWYNREHHDGSGGFRNVWGNDREASFFRALPWLIRRAATSRSHTPPPSRRIEADSLATADGGLQVHWLGHSTTYVVAGNARILFDPIFSERASPVNFTGPRRLVPLPLPLEDLPGVDVVLISHDHYDHLDEQSIRALERAFSPLFIVPLDVGNILRGWGASTTLELDWWQYVDIAGTRYTCTPAQHFSGRGVHNRNGTLWAGWHVTLANDGPTLFYAGDTGYTSHFQEIRERLGPPSVALLPIGAYQPRWFMGVVHIDPTEAIQAFQDLEAAHLVGVHWGTFDLADEPLEEPAVLVRDLARRNGLLERIHVLDVGASFTYERASAGDPTPTGRVQTTPTEAFRSRL